MCASTAPHHPSPPGAICPRCGRTLDASVLRCPFDGSETVCCEGCFESGMVVGGRYHLGEVIGTGGWGVVYRARDLLDGSEAAVKVLSPAHSRDPASVTRFMREQLIIARLHHPHVVAQRQHGQTERGLYIAMELLVGRTLGEEIRERAPLPFARGARIVSQICEALYAAHSRGVIHRDLKPDNAFLGASLLGTDYIKVMDFGIAKLMSDDSDSLTPRLIYGTPHYVSPEQARGDHIDARSDLYSAGVVLFEMLTGQLPFPREDQMLMLQRRIDEDAPDLRRFPGLGVPGGLCDVVRSMLSRDPAGRPRNAAEARELLAAFDELATPRPAPPRAPDTPISAALHTRFAPLDYAPAMVGRDAQRQRLERFVDALGQSPTGAAVLLAGPTGTGKSQLADVVCAKAREIGARVLSIECGAGHPPLHPLALALDQLLGASGLDADATRDELRARFAADELGSGAMADALFRVLRPDDDEPPPAPAGSAVAVRDARLHLVLSTLAQLARSQPLVLTLDDLHRADALTVALFCRAPLWFHDAGRGLLLLGLWTTGASGEKLPAEWPHAGRGSGRHLAERGALVEMAALDATHMDQLLHAIGPIDGITRKYVSHLAQGNPLAALQILRHLKHEHLLIHGYRGWQLAPGAQLERPVPSATDDFARVRLERLRRKRGAGERAADLLERLSLCGDRVPVPLLRRALEIEGRARVGDVLPELLDILAGGDFIRPDDWGDDNEVVFQQALVGQAIAKGFEERADTRATHLAIAQAMSESGRGGDRAIAMHLLSGGAPDRAVPVALRAARHSRAAADLAGASDDFRLALRALDAMASPPNDAWLEARLGLGEMLLLLGNPQQAEAEFRAVLDREDHPAAWLGLGRIAELRSDHEAALADAERAEALWRERGRRREAAEASLLVGKVLQAQSRFAAARDRYEAILRTPDLDDGIVLARARMALGNLCMWLGDSDRCVALLSEAAEILRSRDAFLLAECLNRLGNVRAERGEIDVALDLLRRAQELAEGIGYTRGRAASRFSLGTALGHAGRPEEAARALEEALTIYEDLGDQAGAATCMCNLAWVSRLAGLPVDAAEWAQRAIRLSDQHGAAACRRLSRNELACALTSLGRLDDAAALYQELLAEPEAAADCHAGLGDIARAHGDVRAAEEHYASAGALFRRAGRASMALAVERKVAALAPTASRPVRDNTRGLRSNANGRK